MFDGESIKVYKSDPASREFHLAQVSGWAVEGKVVHYVEPLPDGRLEIKGTQPAVAPVKALWELLVKGEMEW